MSFDITSANATLILTVENLYPSGVKIEGFSTDSSFAMDDDTIAETHMGVDGKMTAGYTPSEKSVTITLDAGSPSYEVLCNIYNTSKTNMTALETSMQITVPSLGKEFSLKNGVMVTGHPIPSGEKVLGNTNWTFHFGKFDSSSI